MGAKFISLRNLKFLLYEVFDVLALTEHPYYRQHNQKVFDLVLDSAHKLAIGLLQPVFREMDEHPPQLAAGQVKVHPAVAGMMKAFGDGGWIAATFEVDCDGEQLPSMVADACMMMFSAANYSASVYPALTAGAARLIATFGDDALKETYLAHMLAGRWQGTMALTEPQAGSSLGDIATTAVPTAQGDYRLRGRKTFISAGDHDGVENVVHLMLARIEGAPPGPGGISLFVVPKKRPDGSGALVSNDITVSQVFHKMGYRGAPITELSIGDRDDCRGRLVGEPHKGLKYMFQMMNEERIGVGMGAAAIASAAYYAALDYCRKRPQGRPLGAKDPAVPQVPIIAHPDIRRMLLFQRAVVEGSLSLLMQCCRYEDQARTVSGEEQQRCRLLLELLTPVAKTFPSEMGILATSQSIQCLGGYGYCEDFPVAQHFRDMRIHPIHEGTTGIQGMDLLGRKVVMQNGRALALFMAEIRQTLDSAREFAELAAMADRLEGAAKRLGDVTADLTALLRQKGPEVFLADATLYLEFFGIVAIAWQWLRQAVAVQRALAGKCSAADARFYRGKFLTARFFFAYELPKIAALAERLTDGNPLTVTMSADDFAD